MNVGDGPSGEGSAEEVGRKLGDYDLVDVIAHGGMGVVFKARQRSLGRWVAVKALSGGMFASEDFAERFRIEAAAAAALDHPNIVPIYEIGESGGQPYFSMKLLEGGTLSGKAKGGVWPVAAAVRVMITVARAVHYAHQRGVLHRDIKPNNILLDSEGEPFLTDFGLAKLVERDSTLTRTVAHLGTPAYMSPEQARGEARSLTTGADVYGLGAVLYELLTGQPPFAGGTTLETVRLVLDSEPRNPSALNRSVDRDLETICLKCLEKVPDHRYGSAEALADDLERWQRLEPILACPTSPFAKLLKWIRRRPAVAGLSALVLLAMLAVFVVSSVFTLRLQSARRDVAHQAESNRLAAVRLLVSEAARNMDDGDYFGALLPLTAALHTEEGMGEGEQIQRRRLGVLLRHCPQLEQLWIHSGQVLHGTLSPDQTRLALGIGDGTAAIWDLKSGERVGSLLSHTNRVIQVVFSPEGQRIATLTSHGKVQLWSVESGLRIGPTIPHRVEFNERIVFSPNGGPLFVPGPTQVGAWRIDADPAPLFTLEEAGLVHGLGLSRDGTRLVTGGADGRACIWELRPNPRVRGTLHHPTSVQHAFFTANDRRVVTIARDRKVRVWDSETGELIRSTESSAADVLGWSASASGQLIATAGFDNTGRIWEATNTGPALAVLPHQGGVSTIEFSHDDTWVVTGSYDGTARRWDRSTGRPLPPIYPHTAGVSVALPADDDRRLVTAAYGGDARLWRLVAHDGARAVLTLNEVPIFAAFSGTHCDVLAVSADGAMRRWSPLGDTAAPWAVRHGAPVNGVALSQDSSEIALGGVDGQVSLWTIGATAPRLRLPAPEGWQPRARMNSGWIPWIALSPDHTRLAVSTADGRVLLWDVASEPRLVATLPHGDAVLAMDFSPDGLSLATSDGSGNVRIWEAADGRFKVALRHLGVAVFRVGFSPDGRRLFSANWDYLNDSLAARIWDPVTGAELGLPRFHRDGVLTARFSPKGHWLATGGEDNLARVWHSDSGAAATPYLQHRGFLTDVAFDASERLVATASRDGTARVWDVRDGRPVTPELRHAGWVNQVAFCADGRFLLTASDDKTVRIWDLAPVDWPSEDLTQLAELLANHRLESNGDRTPLSTAEMKQRWEATQARHPEYWRGR